MLEMEHKGRGEHGALIKKQISEAVAERDEATSSLKALQKEYRQVYQKYEQIAMMHSESEEVLNQYITFLQEESHKLQVKTQENLRLKQEKAQSL